MNIAQLESKTSSELQEIARDMGITGVSKLRKKDLIIQILKAETEGYLHQWDFGDNARGFGFYGSTTHLAKTMSMCLPLKFAASPCGLVMKSSAK